MPGKTGTIAAHFNTAGKMGMQNKVLTIESNAAAGSVTVSLVGEVKEASATANAAPGAKMEVAGSASMVAEKGTDGKKMKEKNGDAKMKTKMK